MPHEPKCTLLKCVWLAIGRAALQWPSIVFCSAGFTCNLANVRGL